MSLLANAKKFEKHHAAILLFLMIASIFLINIFVFSAAYSHVDKLRPARIAPIIAGDKAADDVKIEEDMTEQEPAEFLAGLEPQLLSVVESQDVDMAVYVQDLSRGESIGINDKTTFVSASLYKIFTAYEVARQIDIGQLDPNANAGFDADGTSIADCVHKTLSYSDNPCGRALRKLIGGDTSPLPAIAEAGFVGTSLINDYPTTSASDTGLFFERLYAGETFSEGTNTMLLDALKAQEVNNRLPVPLPDDTVIAHKTADLEGYSHDGGIFYTPAGDYILVVLSGPWPNGYTDSPSAHIAISSLVYQWLNGGDSIAEY